MDTLFIFILFMVTFIFSMLVAVGLHLCLNKFFGIRLFPKGFFHMDKDTWSKW